MALRYNIPCVGSRSDVQSGVQAVIKPIQPQSRDVSNSTTGFRRGAWRVPIASSATAHAALGVLLLLTTHPRSLREESPLEAISLAFQAGTEAPSELNTFPSQAGSTSAGGPGPEIQAPASALNPAPEPAPIPAPEPAPPPTTSSRKAERPPLNAPQPAHKGSIQPSRPPAAVRQPNASARNLPPAGPETGPTSTGPGLASRTVGASQPEVSSGWRNALAGWLQAHKSYPDEARRRGDEGTVLVRFVVGRDGQVLTVTLARSSGSPILDEAAKAIFYNARVPAFTADMIQNQAIVTVPIHYRLEH